ncbi:MAG: hypothetical protein FWG92_06315, partial [Leptospirales bacterium]|nr:hypothetical protein [Leptospirales bacterium]
METITTFNNQRLLDALEWRLIMNEIESRCFTSAGKKAALQVPSGKDEIVKRHKKITALKELMQQGHPLYFLGITDILDIIARAAKDSLLLLEEIVSVKNFLRGTTHIRSFLKEHIEAYPVLQEDFDQIFPCQKLKSELDLSITDDGFLSAARYPILSRLRSSSASARSEAERKLSAMINSPAFEKVVQERIFTTVNQRCCILVKAGMRGHVKGTIHDVSASGSTFYIEPDSVKSLNDKYIMLMRELENEIEKILASLSSLIGEFADELAINVHAAGRLDFFNAGALFSEAVNGSAPEMIDEPALDLKRARHPLLELMQRGAVVANDIELGKEYNCLVVSGANTGGKSVLLKTAGCAVLLAQMGLHIPASPDSQIGFFHPIFAEIGDGQNIQQSLSTYSGQISAVNEMILNAGPQTLILIDEVISGTNPRQGAAIAQAVLEDMASAGCRIIVTTHYSELKELASFSGVFRNASVSFDLDTLRPTYNLVTGLAGVSYALEIAKNCNLKESILERAAELIDSREMSLEAVLEEAQRFKRETEEEKAAFNLQREELQKERERLKEQEHKLAALSREIKEGRGLEFLAELDEMNRQAAARIHLLQTSSMKEASDIQAEINSLRSSTLEKLQKEREEYFAMENIPVNPLEAKPGDRVFAVSIEKEGIIDNISQDMSSAVVIFGAIRARFPFSSLYNPAKAAGGKNFSSVPVKPPKTEGGIIPGVVQTSYNTIDLRGKRVAEAIETLDSGLDSML